MQALRNRVQGPRNQEEFDREASIITRGQRIPGDDLDDVLREIQSGAQFEELSESAGDFSEPDSKDEKLRIANAQAEIVKAATPQPAMEIPAEILDVLKSPERQELLEVARSLRRSHEHARTLLFLTPVGKIRCTVNWMSCRPDQINAMSMFFVKTRADSLAFIPDPGAVFDIAFEGREGHVKVVCLAEPQRLYPGVDLLCFMPHNSLVEKNGQLADGAPSVVSGKPSTEIVDGEPVAKGEQPLQKSAFSQSGHLDFDLPRPQ